MQKKRILFLLALLIFFLLISFKITLFLGHFTPQQQNAIDYLHEETELIGNYTITEQQHMQDVQALFRWIDVVFFILFSVLATFVYQQQKQPREIVSLLFQGGIGITISLFLILLLVFFAFNPMFTIFHQVFFPQGNWQFPADSLLIQTFPLDFFFKISLGIFAQTAGWGILFILISLYYKYASARQRD